MVIRISLKRKSNPVTFFVEACDGGMVVNKVTLKADTRFPKSNKDANDLWQTAIALVNVLPPGVNAAILDSNSDDYKAFAALFDGTPLGGI